MIDEHQVSRKQDGTCSCPTIVYYPIVLVLLQQQCMNRQQANHSNRHPVSVLHTFYSYGTCATSQTYCVTDYTGSILEERQSGTTSTRNWCKYAYDSYAGVGVRSNQTLSMSLYRYCTPSTVLLHFLYRVFFYYQLLVVDDITRGETILAIMTS